MIDAIQPNFADEGFGKFDRNVPKTPYFYTVEASLDADRWHTVIDRSGVGTLRPHELLVLDHPEKARYVRIENKARLCGNFSLYDLRIFGQAFTDRPSEVTGIRAKRNEDKRRIEISWEPSPGARGYVLRWGVDPDETLLSCQTLENKVELGLFSTDQKYYFRVDAFGDGGVISGRTIVTD